MFSISQGVNSSAIPDYFGKSNYLCKQKTCTLMRKLSTLNGKSFILCVQKLIVLCTIQ